MATRKAVELDLGPHVRDRQTYIIQHHRLVPPSSGRAWQYECILY